MTKKELKKVLDDFLYRVATLLTDEGVVCFTHESEPLLAYLTDDCMIGRQYVQALRRPPGFASAPYLFGIVVNLTSDDGEQMPLDLNMTHVTSKMGSLFVGFSDRHGVKLVCTPEEMKEVAPFVSMIMMCDARPSDPPVVLCPVMTCTPPMSEEIWTVDAFRADEKACLLALNEIADKDDPLA